MGCGWGVPAPALLLLALARSPPGFWLAARWNRLSETVTTRKKRERTGGKWARYGLTRCGWGRCWWVNDDALGRQGFPEVLLLPGPVDVAGVSLPASGGSIVRNI